MHTGAVGEQTGRRFFPFRSHVLVFVRKWFRMSGQIFWEAAGLERGPLSLVRTTEELHEGKVAAPV
jgi:hypothetical protein